jgi:glycosyltransferase involved in cell wall biosynthesis
VTAPSVLLITRTLPWHIQGGFEEHGWNLATSLASLGARVTIVTTRFPTDPLAETRQGVRIEYAEHLPINHARQPMWRWWKRFPQAARTLVLELGLQPDLLISEGRGGRALLQDKKVHKGRTVIVSHGTFEQNYRLYGRPDLVRRLGWFHPRAIGQAILHRLERRKDRRDLRHARFVVAVSPFVAASLRETYHVPSDRLHIIGNGVRLPTKVPSKNEARADFGLGPGIWLLFLGRLEAVKRPRAVIDAVRGRPKWNVMVAGTGPEEKALRALIVADPELRDRVQMLGRVSDEDKWRAYAACDVFVLPSKSEGEPISILEALAMQRPVVTTHDWVASDVQEGCTIADDVTAGVDRALRETLPLRDIGRRVRSDHTWESVAKRFLALARE